MSEAKKNFEVAIQDAENLLRHFDTLNSQPPPPENEVLKRAGLIMAMTAWETYVEDRLQEATDTRLAKVRDKSVAEFVRKKLKEEICRLNNPDYARTVNLFAELPAYTLRSTWPGTVTTAQPCGGNSLPT